jgi:lipopolysaccharide/colanic/teichoic acid biosynthesis glycosyltransferase
MVWKISTPIRAASLPGRDISKLRNNPPSEMNPRMKRSLDLIVSILLLVLTLPLVGLVALAILVSMGPPVFFRQVRPGLHCQPFSLLKFRSMCNAYDDKENMLPGQQRITRLGRLLRSLSLDELPQLFNVLRGDMSLVGPRPLLTEYLELYTPEQMRRQEVKPGITGWAQVNGRNGITWEDKFALDVWYVDHQSIWLDLKILWLTLIKVVSREGVTTAGGTLAAHFSGTRKEKGERILPSDSLPTAEQTKDAE